MGFAKENCLNRIREMDITETVCRSYDSVNQHEQVEQSDQATSKQSTEAFDIAFEKAFNEAADKLNEMEQQKYAAIANFSAASLSEKGVGEFGADSQEEAEEEQIEDEIEFLLREIEENLHIDL